MTIREAVAITRRQFPFTDYIPAEVDRRGAHLNVARTVLRHLAAGATILDFGCGPCDKTAVVQMLGFRCSGYDDLGDEWHALPGSREKILSFAQACGIDFRLATGGKLPFEKNSFDMVMLHDVLEHLHDSPRELLNDLLELTTPEGLLFATVPNAANVRKRLELARGGTNLPRYYDYYWSPGRWRGHVREYVRGDLVRLAEYLNLDVLEIRACDHMLTKCPGPIRPAFLALSGLFAGWKDTWSLVARKMPGWKPRRGLAECGSIRA